MRRLLPALFLAAVAAPTTAVAQAPTWAAALDSAMNAELRRTGTPGAQVAVVVDGRLVFTKGYGVADIETGRAVTEKTMFRVGSVTKMITGAVLAQLASEGKLDLQAPIARYVTELEGRGVARVTTHQLLTHTAGWLDNAVPYGRMGEGALGEVMREVTDTLFFTEPGKVLSYSNPAFSMAGYVAERAGNGRFGSLAEDKVLRAVGMPTATFRPLQALTMDFSQGHIGPPTGGASVIVRPWTENTAQWAAGFLMASAGEFARFPIALMDAGRIDGRQVISADAVRLVTTGYQPVPGDSVARYGYGLVVTRRGGERVWQHGGSINGFDAQVVMFPDRKFALMLFDNRSGAPLQGITDLVARLALGIVPPTPGAAPAERVATAEERARFVGTYRMGGALFELLEDGGELKLRQGPGAPIPVRLLGDDRLVAIPPQGNRVTLIYVRGTDGRVEYLHLGMRSLARQR